MTETEPPLAETTALDDWVAIQALFSAKDIMRPRMAWLNGISSRLSGRRLGRLMEGKNVGRLAAYLDQCSDDRLKALRTYAAINLEQAMAAFRMTIIANVSAPIVLISVVHQFLDGGLGAFLTKIHQGDPSSILGMLIGGGIGVLMLLLVIMYAVANLNQARDIRHLIDLLGADRGIYFGLEDAEDLHSP